jgi:sensor histidine kinase regulating citrate/malate metabolism
MQVYTAQNKHLNTPSCEKSHPVEANIIALCAHDIANALQYIQGILQLWEKEEEHHRKKEQYTKSFLVLNRAIERNKIIMNLVFHQKDTGFNPGLEQIIDRIIYDIPADIRIEKEISLWTPPITVPMWIIESFIQNVVENTNRSMSMDNRSYRKTIKIRDGIEEQYYTIEISDNGKGIDENTLKTLGKKPIKNHTGRNGKSMYILSELAKQYGGQIRIRSEEGKGASFKLQAPFL